MMLPLLRVLAEANAELRRKDATERVADAMGITEEERTTRMPSGTQTHLFNRMGWAVWSLQKADLLDKPRRGGLLITEEGRKLLETKPALIDNNLLAANSPSFQKKISQIANPDTVNDGPPQPIPNSPPTYPNPTKQIEQAEPKLNDQLAADLLDLMSRMAPYRFEQFVVDLLFAMGYGGSRAEAAQVTQKSNDGGIDGIIMRRPPRARRHLRPGQELAEHRGARADPEFRRCAGGGSMPPTASSSPPATSTKRAQPRQMRHAQNHPHQRPAPRVSSTPRASTQVTRGNSDSRLEVLPAVKSPDSPHPLIPPSGIP